MTSLESSRGGGVTAPRPAASRRVSPWQELDRAGLGEGGARAAVGVPGPGSLGVSGEQRTTATSSDTRAVAALRLWPGRWKVTLFSQGESLKAVDEGTPALGVTTGKAGLVLHGLSYL